MYVGSLQRILITRKDFGFVGNFAMLRSSASDKDEKRKLECDVIIDPKRTKLEVEKVEKKLNHSFRSKQKLPIHMRYAKQPLFQNKDIFKETEYYFENGFRKVHPYYFDFNTFCKGRWLGKTLREVYTTEFSLYPIEHYERAVLEGGVKVNLKPVVSLDVKLRDNDMISARLHRHEAPVLDTKVEIIEDNSKYVVVNKPSSIPIHPCGRFRNNSLVYILAKDLGYQGLLGCHRIDRLTSGIVIFGKTKNIAHKVAKEISERKVEKQYVCKVVGEFPSTDIVCNEPVSLFNRKLGYAVAWKVEGVVGKEASTWFTRMSYDGTNSVVLCKPKTGRTHQIRVHLQYLGFPIINDPIYNHPAWGEERFKVGRCTRGLGEVVDQISKQFLQTKDEQKQIMKESLASMSEAPAVDGDRYAPSCVECIKPLPDPNPQSLFIYLHALSYKGPDWEFKTNMPAWAN
nr:RNA pseudouridylate synthase domain-containing protein 2 isoform X2 [Ciona intestinalis]|eukprot:XP_002128102.1 RNA pseudouridylate synthase domain-containing protein 2 isoform X2 [Ciona intestinalis]